MKLIKRLGNNYELIGLTLGKVLAVENALKTTKEVGELSPVGEDVLAFLISQKLVHQDEWKGGIE